MGTVNLNAVANYSLATGVTVSGFELSDTLILTMEASGTYTAWSAWPISLHNCSVSTGCSPIGYPDDYMGYLNQFRVNAMPIIGTNKVYPTQADAKTGFAAEFPNGAKISGASSYTFYINDPTAYSDNIGGLSIHYEVVKAPANALMFSCNT